MSMKDHDEIKIILLLAINLLEGITGKTNKN